MGNGQSSDDYIADAVSRVPFAWADVAHTIPSYANMDMYDIQSLCHIAHRCGINASCYDYMLSLFLNYARARFQIEGYGGGIATMVFDLGNQRLYSLSFGLQLRNYLDRRSLEPDCALAVHGHPNVYLDSRGKYSVKLQYHSAQAVEIFRRFYMIVFVSIPRQTTTSCLPRSVALHVNSEEHTVEWVSVLRAEAHVDPMREVKRCSGSSRFIIAEAVLLDLPSSFSHAVVLVIDRQDHVYVLLDPNGPDASMRTGEYAASFQRCRAELQRDQGRLQELFGGDSAQLYTYGDQFLTLCPNIRIFNPQSHISQDTTRQHGVCWLWSAWIIGKWLLDGASLTDQALQAMSVYELAEDASRVFSQVLYALELLVVVPGKTTVTHDDWVACLEGRSSDETLRQIHEILASTKAIVGNAADDGIEALDTTLYHTEGEEPSSFIDDDDGLYASGFEEEEASGFAGDDDS